MVACKHMSHLVGVSSVNDDLEIEMVVTSRSGNQPVVIGATEPESELEWMDDKDSRHQLRRRIVGAWA